MGGVYTNIANRCGCTRQTFFHIDSRFFIDYLKSCGVAPPFSTMPNQRKPKTMNEANTLPTTSDAEDRPELVPEIRVTITGEPDMPTETKIALAEMARLASAQLARGDIR
jgi:hypothetical protein